MSSHSSSDSLFSLFNARSTDDNDDQEITNPIVESIQLDPQDETPALYISPLQSSSIVKINQVAGLYYIPSLINHELEIDLLQQISETNLFDSGHQNQLMYFSKPPTQSSEKHSFLNWPLFLIDLIEKLPILIHQSNHENLDQLNDLISNPLKSKLPWQIILNLYRPSEGIKPHIDLLDRFDDIIIGISLGASVVMDFENQTTHQPERIFLEKGSGYILSGDARYKWTHGIKSDQLYDFVYDPIEGSSRKIQRSRTRISITIRRLKEGGEVLGEALNRSPS